MNQLLDEANAIRDDLVALRHDLHQHPEVGSHLPWTKQRVLTELAPLDLEIREGPRTDWVAAILRGGKPGPVVMLRADMDALPVTEATGLDFASTNGAMHACGHDLHTTGLVGAARLLTARRDELAGSVVFLFQQEEEGPRGAIDCIEEGCMDVAGERPVAVHGIHVMADYPVGVFRAIAGATTAGFGELNVTVKGKGGHASRPYQSKDPIMAAGEMLTALNAFVTRRFNIFDPIVITVGQIHGGSASNVIPDQCFFQASVRYYSKESGERLASELPTLLQGIAQAHQLDADVVFDEQEPPTINDATETERAFRAAGEVFGDHVDPLPYPHAGSDDVGRFLELAPGCYAYIGARPNDAVVLETNHSPRVRFDDSVLPQVSAYLATVTLDRLAEG